LEMIGQTAVTGIRRALPGIDACGVSLVRPTPGDPHTLTSLFQQGVPQEVVDNYERLRHTFRFAATTALRTLEPEICEEVIPGRTYTGTQRVMRIWRLGAYASFPIIAAGKPLGLLTCLSQTPRRFSTSERAFLQAMADELALAIRRAAMHQHC